LKQISIEAFEKMQVLVIKAGGVFTALFMVAIYFSTSLAIILSVLLGLFWLLSAQFMALTGTIKRNPVAAWSLLLFLCFIFGLCYTSATNSDAFSMLMKYRELLFIPVLCSFLSTERYRCWVWKAFAAASTLILLISYLMDIGILDLNSQGDPAFKSRITHSILISFFAFYCVHKACDGKRYAKLHGVLFLLCVYNLFFMVEGRIGQLTAALLFLLFAAQRFTKKMLLLTVLVMAVFLALFFAFSDKATRINEGVVNIQSDLHPDARQIPSSMGQRYMFWKYSLKLIAEKPLLGHGTGSFAKEYRRIASSELFLSKNPHNEFFMITVQLGILGLLIFLGFLASQYYCAKKLPDKEKWLAQGLLLSLIVTSLFNSPLLDHTEGHWFASMIALCFASLQTEHKIEVNNA
jgi:O-antigen ligase